MPLTQKPVHCDCPAEFVMSILDTLPGDVQMAACMKCGCSDLADPVVSEDRPHDVQLHGYSLFDLSAEAREWASAWPRFAVVNDRWVYLPAHARFETGAECQAAVLAAAAQQTGVMLREKLLSLGIPAGPPPPSLPGELAGFVEMWEGLKLNQQTPVEQLLDAATRFNGPNRLAGDVLSQRSDLGELAVFLFRAPELERRGYGRYLVKNFDVAGPELLMAIGECLHQLNDNRTGELYELCNMLAHMTPAPLTLLPAVEAVAERAKDRDYYAHQDLVALIERWKAVQ
ncbi:MAG TPA: hypothetical protein VHW09_17115 [Bryobacteraceae bacterium]|jgi:hypothetical protein|nr:hypothetical protein [Bryobacteraceae bacterium]